MHLLLHTLQLFNLFDLFLFIRLFLRIKHTRKSAANLPPDKKHPEKPKLLRVLYRLNYSASSSSIILSHMMRQRGRWKGPLKVEPLVEGMVGRPSRRR